MSEMYPQTVQTNTMGDTADLGTIIYEAIRAAMSEDLTDFEGIEVTTIPYTVYGVKIAIPLKRK